MNITDVDDKIIKSITNIPSFEKYDWQKKIKIFTDPYIKAFFSDAKSLNIKKAGIYPRATANIVSMIRVIEALLRRKYAYIASDGAYFNVKKFKKYGKLSNLKKRQIKPGARVSADEYQKDNASDFVLWKKSKNGEPKWPSPWGCGRPGWHIECAAMSIKYLGQPFDIHTGAVDLLFPHHENEIAEAEAAFDKKFANYFLEGEHLLIEGQKMAKSLGNVLNLAALRRKGFDPLSFRYLCLTSHYRNRLNFTWQSLKASQNALNSLKEAIMNLVIHQEWSKKNQKLKIKNKNYNLKFKNDYKKKFLKFVNDDLNAPEALSVARALIADFNLNSKNKLDLLLEFDQILGLGLEYYYKIGLKKAKGIAKITPLIKTREKFRREKRWQEADRIRQKIEERGYIVEDSDKGVIVKFLISNS